MPNDSTTAMPTSDRLARLLTHRRWPIALVLLAAALALPSLGIGWHVDDYYHRLVFKGWRAVPGFSHSPLDMFRFFDGDADRTRLAMDAGLLPWWTYPEIRAQFLRPVTVATHWLDYQLWPDQAWLMHAHSILWYVAIVAAAAMLYRRTMGPTVVAGLAALLYAIDDAHGGPVGWLANRNALLATFFGLSALIAHDRWRRDGWRLGAIVAPTLFVISLLSAEAGIATGAYVIAHVLFIDRGRPSHRAGVFVLYAGIVIAWRLTWHQLGYGVSDLGLYVDPLTEPARFVRLLLQRVPTLLLAQWAGPPGELTIFISAWGRAVWALVAAAFVILLALLLIPLLRRDRVARFWAAGMVLAVVPICATFPADRLLFFVGLGAMGLLAQFLVTVFSQAPDRSSTRAWRIPAKVLGVLFVVVHLVIAPVFMAVRAALPMGSTRLQEQIHVPLPLPEAVEDQTLVIVNAPSALHAGYTAVISELEGFPVPEHVRVLAPALPSVTIRRLDAHTLSIRPGDGFMAWVFDQLFRNEEHPLVVGDRIELTGMTVEVTGLTADGRPAEAMFRFDVPLEHESLHWLAWHELEFVPFAPPPIDEQVVLRAPPAFPSL